MADDLWDVIIVGQGLAGTTLAWHLRDAGKRVLVLDAAEAVTSSKIAAGLITPITGQRLTVNPHFDAFMTAARAFYRGVEKQTAQKFFHDRIALRLFTTEAERRNWAVRLERPDTQAHLVSPQPAPLLDPDLADAGAGGFAMHAAQLDVAAYLEACRVVLTCETAAIDWQKDVTFHQDGVCVGGRRTRLLISCEGYAAARNRYLSAMPFNAAKGDILTVRFHNPLPARSLPAQSVHRGVWLAPTAEPEIFSVGSTYDWQRLDQEPDADARAEIEMRMQSFVRLPWTVLDHRAAVRPILSGARVLAGLHPDEARLGFFNGLGSKGALLAPWHAEKFAALLVRGTPLSETMTAGCSPAS